MYVYVCVSMYVYVCLYVCVCVFMYVYVCMCVCMYVCVCAYVCIRGGSRIYKGGGGGLTEVLISCVEVCFGTRGSWGMPPGNF